MAGFKDVIGQEKIVSHFENAIRSEKISHAYLLNGEKGMGKKMLANAFALTVLCERGGVEPCMTCHACKQTISGNNPDIKWIQHEKENVISVSEIRSQVVNDIGVRPYEYRKKIYVIDEAEKMNEAAQNALLKSMEEPPDYAVLLLLVSNKDMLLDTILSRCVQMDLQPVDGKKMEEYLCIRERIVDYRARDAVLFANGNIGKAKEMCQSDDFFMLKDEIIRLLKGIGTSRSSELAERVKEFYKENKNQLEKCFNLLELWYRDVLIYKATEQRSRLIFQKEESIVRQQAELVGYEGLNHIFEAISKIRNQLNSNVNKEISFEMLFLKIKDYYGGQ